MKMNRKFFKIAVTIAAIGLWNISSIAQTKPMNEMWGESKVSVDALKAGRGKLFDEGNFGMFIHWGLFSHLGGKWQRKNLLWYWGMDNESKHGRHSGC